LTNPDETTATRIDKSLGELLNEQTARIIYEIARREEMLLRRMLHFWQPAWGKPTVFSQDPGPEPIPRFWRETCTFTVRSNIVGLGPDCAIGEIPIILVRACDHIGEGGAPLPPPEPQMSDDTLKEILR
jgi:hypothetical protein